MNDNTKGRREVPDPASDPVGAALHHLSEAAVALHCIFGPFEPIAQATARDLDRYALALNSISDAIGQIRQE